MALHERAGVDIVKGKILSIAQPAPKVIGVVVERAHVAGANIEQVIVVRRGISDPRPDSASALNKRHDKVVAMVAQQMARHQDAAGAAADYDHALAGNS